MGYKGKSSEAPCVKAARLYLACDVRRPNITGGFGDAVWSGNARDAIHVRDVSLNKVNRNVTSGGTEISSWIDFDAWRSDALYGAASTVQPSALRMMLCIKF